MDDKIVLEGYHILMLLVPLIVFFAVMWRTWIGPQIEHRQEVDTGLLLVRKDVTENAKKIERLEADSISDRRRVYERLDTMTALMASIEKNLAHIEGRMTIFVDGKST